MEKLNDAALLVMDMQEQMLKTLPNSNVVIEKTAEAIAYARNAQIPVIYIVVGFREGLHDIHPDNKRFGRYKSMLQEIDLTQWTKIHESIKPIGDEPISTKRRFSAFAGSDLEVILRSKGIRHLILTGIVTSGVILSTATEAADKDYKLTILSDACMDRDEELHYILMEKYFPNLADVISVKEWTEA